MAKRKRGMKRGTVCLSPSEQKVLHEMDKAIAKLKALGRKKAKARAK